MTGTALQILLCLSILTGAGSGTKSNSYEGILEQMHRVADWQLANPYTERQKNDWQWGAFYTGLMAAYEASGEDRFLEEMLSVGQEYDWEMREDVLHADRLLIADMYAYLYEKDQNPEYIEQVKWAFDLHLARKSLPNLSHFPENSYRSEWWSWCDALYMAPPSFYHMANVLDEPLYRDYAFEHWKGTTEYLYSPEDSLFFRDDRYFEELTTNGKKVFWSRGNGWVVAGLARMMTYLPEDHEQRDYYEALFRQMAYKLKRLQMEEGLWTVSLLDPEELYLGESSGSGFFGFALTWGINQGILEREIYEPAVKKAWNALNNNVNESGRLGYVQQIAGSPFPFTEEQWHVYASGGYLLFASEMLKLIQHEE